MVVNICYSGGAVGADTCFASAALLHGHEVCHFSFSEHNTLWKDHIQILSNEQLQKNDDYLEAIAKRLGRPFKTNKTYIKNLLRRNFYQVMNTGSVYAVGNLRTPQIISGGTAWTIEMAKDQGVPIWFYEQNDCKWYDLNTGNSLEFMPPKPSGYYTGIGTRELNADGWNAIANLYAQNS